MTLSDGFNQICNQKRKIINRLEVHFAIQIMQQFYEDDEQNALLVITVNKRRITI